MNFRASKKIMICTLILLAAIILGWGIFLQFQSGNNMTANYAFNLGYALLYAVGGMVGIFGAWYHRKNKPMGKAFLCLGLAQLAFAAGLCVWAYYNVFVHISVPYPSIAELFFALFYPFMALGCWYFFTLIVDRIRIEYLFEVLGIFFVSAMGIVGFITASGKNAQPIFTTFINLWSLLGDCMLIAIAYLILRAGKGKYKTGILILGLLVQVFADAVFTYRTGLKLYWNGDISDILLAISGGIISLGIMDLFFTSV